MDNFQTLPMTCPDVGVYHFNWLSVLLLQLTPPSDLHRDAHAVKAALLCSCYGHLSCDILHVFIDALSKGRIQLDLLAIYHQLTDDYFLYQSYLLVRCPRFDMAALNNATCDFTPLGRATVRM